ncbi:MAG TPA: phosphoadenosine phosphosulfate reductase family protein [Solimonas sp.]
MNVSLETINAQWGQDAPALLRWSLEQAAQRGGPAIVTSNFRPYAAVMLHLATQVQPDLPVIWMDSGYNTPETYRYAEDLRARLGLNLHVYTPARTRAQREALEGPPPSKDDPRFEAFVEEVKLAPFARALDQWRPSVWLHGARGSDSEHRATMQPVSINERGILKVAPLLSWSTRDLHRYLQDHGLPNHWDYFDPTKPDPQQECGLLVTQ